MALLVRHDGQDLELDVPGPDAAPTLARLLWLEGPLPPRPLCAGIGLCGRCRVLFHSPPPPPTPSERRILSPEDLQRGVRLACRHQARDGMQLEMETDDRQPATAPPFGKAAHIPAVSATGRPAGPGLHLAVDLGTTTLAWQAGDDAGNILAAGERPNPQAAAGADIMARLAEGAAPGGSRRLQALIVDALEDIVDNLADSGWEVADICLAANPAMTALALGLDASGLRAAPYRLDYPGGGTERLGALPPLWIPPQLGPFVGGDISAGLATLLDAPRPFLLADMGTNGEFALVRPRHDAHPGDVPLLAASVPLGPALEGVGLRCGGVAGPGGVVSFHAGPGGLTPVTLDGGMPRHICGTGYLSLIRCLLRLGLLDADGHFLTDVPAVPGPLEFLRARLAASLRPVPGGDGGTDGEPALPLPGDLFLSAGDVESILQVKAAFSLAVERLLAEAGLSADALDRIYLAGALGRHAPLEALQELGFLPPGTARKTLPLGNAALEGAALLSRGAPPARETLPSPTSRDALRHRLAAFITPRRVLDLASDPFFHQSYIRHMRFGDTQRIS